MINFPIVLFWIKFLSPSIDDGAIHGLTKQLEKINYSQLAGVANPKDASTWKGVNLTLQINQGNAKNLAQEDFDYAANAGANVIRLVINADPKKKNSSTFFDESGNILPQSTSPGIHDIKQAVEMARKANLKLILDMSTMPGATTNDIGKDFTGWEKLRDLWQQIASVSKNEGTIIAFDLMNEPGLVRSIPDQSEKSSVVSAMSKGNFTFPEKWKNTARDYKAEITKLIRAIRNIDPERTIIVEGYGLFGQPINFRWLQPIVGFDNIVYSFHMYIPPTLTMIGTSGFEGRGATPKPFIYPKDVHLIDNAFAPVLEFQKKYNVQIYVGEFGVTDEGIYNSNSSGIPYNAACWLNVVINKMNENRWGWTYWSFWTEGRKPTSTSDPRYIILSEAMKGETLKDYCK